MSNSPTIHKQAWSTLELLSWFWQFKRKKLVAELQGHLNDAQCQLDTLFSTSQQLTTQCVSQNEEIVVLKSRNVSLIEALQIERDNSAVTAEVLAQEKGKVQRAMLALTQALDQLAGLEEQLGDYKQKIFDKEYCIQELQQRLANSQLQLDELIKSKEALTKECIGQLAYIGSLESENHALIAKLRAERASAAELKECRSQALVQIVELETSIEKYKTQLMSTEQDIDFLEDLTEHLKASQQHLEDNYAVINNQHLSLTEKFLLVSNVLAQQPPINEELAKFSDLIKHDYMEFASRESSLTGAAQAVLDMQAILAEMQMLSNFTSIAGKTILSIAGGFSSGKSAFVNSLLLNPSVKLATGINPVTVVPSYVVCSEETRIKGYSYTGGAIDLAPNLYASMCHEYVKAFGFDLRRILPFISVNVPMAPDLFGNLCLIDTPGYNPGATGGAAASDRATATSLVNQAQALVWVIGLDPAGTIDQSDIEFIESTAFRSESLYIVLNKADVKSQDDILKIMEQVADDLSFSGIDYAGMCAYSSILKNDYPSRGLTFDQFLRSINRKVDVVGRITGKLDTVFDSYKQAIQADIAQLKSCKYEFNMFKLDALELGGTALFDKIDQAFPMSEQMFDSSGLERLVTECEALREKLKLAARKALGVC